MNKTKLKKIEKEIKDLLLFDSSWKKRHQPKTFSKKELQRLAIYRELVRNSLYGVISAVYPYTESILKNSWEKILSDYLEKYPPDSPVLIDVSRDFPQYLNENKNLLKKFPYISELALYEWLELEVQEMENEKVKSTSSLKLNPTCKICKFTFPVLDILNSIDNNLKVNNIKEKNNIIVVYRDSISLTVRFFEISSATLCFIELLKLGLDKKSVEIELMNLFNITPEGKKDFLNQINFLIKDLKKNNILI